MAKKFIFENGVMKLNPEYAKEQAKQGNPTTVAQPTQALAIVSSMDDVQAATQLQLKERGIAMTLSDATVSSMEIMQDDEFVQSYKSKKPLDGSEVLEGLTGVFSRYEVPIGLVNKLLALSEYHLNFIIDNSGSMRSPTDALVSDASEPMKSRLLASGRKATEKMTRWEEAEDRLHVLIEFLQYIPAQSLTISCFEDTHPLSLDRTGRTPEEFGKHAHAEITKKFSNQGFVGHTPTYDTLKYAFEHARGQTMHYFFTDGVPSGTHGVKDVTNLIKDRKNPQQNPLTFVTCTNVDSEAEWMKKIDEANFGFISELDDFKDERDEILQDQGPGFPFSRGLWLICHLAAAINPDDLDALDEDTPIAITKLSNLLGRNLTPEEYQQYWNLHPKSRQYMHRFAELSKGTAMSAPATAAANPAGFWPAAPAPVTVTSATNSGGGLLGMFGRNN